MKNALKRREFIKEAFVGLSLTSLGIESSRAISLAQSVGNTPKTRVMKGPAAVDLFPLSAVRLLEGPFKNHQELDRNYLHKLEPDRLLSWCRGEAGLEPKAPPYGGWESEGLTLPGAILGFYLSSASMMYQATGDEILHQRIDYIVKELAEVQRANGNGYLLPTVNGKTLFQEVAKGRIEIGYDRYTFAFINGVFEPTYVLNKMMLGLYAAHLLAGNRQACEVLIRAADWFGYEVLDKLNEDQTQKLLDCEHGSINESFGDVYELTGDEKYLRWARRLCHRVMLDPISEGEDILTQWHANTQIPKFTGFQRIHTFTGEQRLANAADFFWKTVVSNRSWVNGGNSADEHFFDPLKFGEALLTLTGPETCNSVNMLRLTEALYRAYGSVSMVDYYERTLYNHILPAHDPEGGMFVYYTSMRPAHYRVYSDEYDSMWCCVGTGMESPAKYGRMIYAHDSKSIYVNLFIPSELKHTEKGMTLRQETRYPHEARTRLKLSCQEPVKLALKIRHPWWLVAGAMNVWINGEKQDVVSQPHTYATLVREWKTGDTVEIEMPMRLTVEALANNESYVAVLYGPIVLAGELGSDGLGKENFWSGGRESVARVVLPEDRVPVLVGARDEILRQIERIPGEMLSFRTVGLAKPHDMKLVPFFDLHYKRYMIYWRLMRPEEWDKELARREEVGHRAAELDGRTVDRVLIGDKNSERAHAIRMSDSVIGNAPAPCYRTWRQITNGGFFSYEMKVLPEVPLAVYCEHSIAGSESRMFDVLVEDFAIAAQPNPRTEEREPFRRVTYRIPPELTRGKSSATVKFQAPRDNVAGGVFICRIVRV